MALNKDILGVDLYEVRNYFSNKTMSELLQEFGTLENMRIQMCKREAAVIINHFKNYGDVIGNVATTGTAQAQTGSIITGTGKIQ